VPKNYYKITVESGILDDSKVQERTYYIDEDDDNLLWLLLNRIGVHETFWQDQQRRRTQEQYQRDRQRREERPTFNFTGRSDGGDPFESFFSAYTQYNRFHYTPPGTGGKTSTNTRKAKLAEMAGIDWAVAQLMEDKALLKKAQRKCHPDTGGSHEKWIELDKLRQEMGL
jgi:hypothetical protein